MAGVPSFEDIKRSVSLSSDASGEYSHIASFDEDMALNESPWSEPIGDILRPPQMGVRRKRTAGACPYVHHHATVPPEWLAARGLRQHRRHR